MLIFAAELFAEFGVLASRFCSKIMPLGSTPAPDGYLSVAKKVNKSAIACGSICFSRPSGINDIPVFRKLSM
jgi:hypothetical protein